MQSILKKLRHRYIGFYIKKSNEKIIITKNDLLKEIKKKCLSLFNKNFNEIGAYIIRFDGDKGIIKCNNMNKETTINLLKSIEKISTNKIQIITLGTSGTIKGLIKKHMNKEIKLS